MSWLDTLLDRGKPAEPVALPKPTKPRQPKPEIKSVWVQTRAPDGDLGAVEAVFYFVTDGILFLCDEGGKPAGKQHWLEPDDDPRRIAGRLARETRAEGTSDFNRSLHYSKMVF
jgi:hypothetical protein